MKKTLQYGSRIIEYILEFSTRKSLGITVTPEMNVIVKAPENASDERVEELIKKRAPWILKQQSYFLAFYPKQTVKKYIGGETHLYLGRQYRLKVKLGKKESVRLTGKYIDVVCQDRTRTKKLLNAWYKRLAAIKIDFYAQDWIEKFSQYKVAPSIIELRKMPKRWGSCTASKKIIINPELIKAPRGCIEYVIVHELCHLVHHNHSQKFIDLQAKMMPNWQKWKTKLEQLLA
jgi:predicted metal-dependent hydrolase